MKRVEITEYSKNYWLFLTGAQHNYIPIKNLPVSDQSHGIGVKQFIDKLFNTNQNPSIEQAVDCVKLYADDE